MGWTRITTTAQPARLVKLGDGPDEEQAFTGVYLGTKPGPHRLLLRFEAGEDDVALVPRYTALDRMILNDYRGVLVTLSYEGPYITPAGHVAKRIGIKEHLDMEAPEWLGRFPSRDLSRTSRPIGNEKALPILEADPDAPLWQLLEPDALAVLRDRLKCKGAYTNVAKEVRWWLTRGWLGNPSSGLIDFVHNYDEMTRPITLDDLKGGWD